MTIAASISAELRRIRSTRFARNVGWMLAGQGASFLLQAAYFVLLARLLGAKEYGVFAGAFAFANIAMPYSTLGSGTVFMRHVGARNSEFAPFWGNILLSTLFTGCLLVILLRALAPHLLNQSSASIVLMVAVGNCIFSQLVNCMGQVFQTFELLRMTAFLNLITNALRLVVVAAMSITLSHAVASQWAPAFLAISSVAALIGFIIVSSRFGAPRFVPRMVLKYAMEGLGFSMGGSAQSIYNDIDKTMLSHYGLNRENGIYTLAYRIVDIATIPIGAVDAAALPRYFRTAGDNLRSIPPLAFRLSKRTFLLGLAASGALFLLAPLIPFLLGKSYTESVLALRWLCILPAFRGLHQLTGSAITGMGLQRIRTIAQFAAALGNFLLNLWLIPRFGWVGAAWSSLATDGALVLMNWSILNRLSS